MRAHGTYACYVWGPEPGSERGRGCRCDKCREAVRQYQAQARQRVAPAYVDATEVREHIGRLMAAGVGLKQITKLSGVSGGSLTKIVYGTPRGDGTRRPPARRVKRETRDRIMAVMPSQVADGARVDAEPVWADVRELLRRGWTKVAIARELGQTSGGLQLGTATVTAGHARTIRGLLAQPVPPRRSRHGEHPVPQPEPAPEPPRLVTSGEASLAQLFGGVADVPARVLDQGACRLPNVPSWIFFPDPRDRETIAAAKRVCSTCPVQAECLAHAMANPEVGVWGGTTEVERRERGAVEHRPRPIVHGTAAGYQAHRRRGETPCSECRAAHSEAGRMYRGRRAS